MNKFFFLLPGLVLFATCKETGKKNLQPEIALCDSAVIMYYHTPGNPRFFDMTRVYDKQIITAFSKDVNQNVMAVKDSCPSQGKIYFYGEKGAVYVVYFSRVDDCLTLSFIKTGEKYFTRMSSASKNRLDSLQKEAKQPNNQ